MDLALNNLQRLIYHKTQTYNQASLSFQVFNSYPYLGYRPCNVLSLSLGLYV